MADFEDSNSPTWSNNVEGQINLRDANRRDHQRIYKPGSGKKYKLNEKVATLFCPAARLVHLNEKHVLSNGKPISGSFVRFWIVFFP